MPTRDPARAFFIAGCPRSGTTLLRWMLNAHPSIAVTPETHFGELYVKSRGRRDAAADRPSRSSVLDDFCRSAAFDEMALDEGTFRDRASLHPDDPWWPLRIAMQDFARSRKASWVGEKTPSHALYSKALSTAFPEARFVFVRRDPRAVVASWRRASWSGKLDVEVAEVWRRSSRAMRGASDVLGDRCLEVDYEGLVRDPGPTLRAVCALLEEAFDPQMLRYFDRDDDTMSEAERVDHALTFESPRCSRISAWREVLDDRCIAGIEAVCGREMTRYRYRRESSVIGRSRASITRLAPIWKKRIKRTLRRSS